MAALTLVMTELADLDPEEFLNVRAYHTCGKDFRQVLRAGGPPSPTNSESSGVSSLTISSNGEEEPRASTPAQPNSKDVKALNSCPETNRKVQRVNFVKNVPKEEENKNDRIIYRGRDILNLERNTQPFKWQLASPIQGVISPYAIACQPYIRLDGDALVEEYPMNKCEGCDFRQPSPDYANKRDRDFTYRDVRSTICDIAVDFKRRPVNQRKNNFYFHQEKRK